MCYYKYDRFEKILADETFFDFYLGSRRAIITDYSYIKKEIVTIGDNIFGLGNSHEKMGTICYIDTLKKQLQHLTLFVQETIRKNAEKYKAKIYFDLDKVPEYDKKLNYYIFDAQIENMELFINQLVFDILYDKYCADSLELTLNNYCSNHICYDWDNSPRDLKEKIDAANKFMAYQMQRQADISNNPHLKRDAVELGYNPDKRLKYLTTLNKPLEKDITKPKIFWDYMYYNGHPDLITSKQFNRSFLKKTKNNKPTNNYSKDDVNEYFKTYYRFIQMAFMQSSANNEEYFNNSMRFYHLEKYKRIDFIYKLAVRMESAGFTDIHKKHFLVGRFVFDVLRPYVDENDCFKFDECKKYYTPIIFLEDLWQNKNMFEHDKFYEAWFIHHYVRAKVYELFKYHFKFEPENYDDMANFIRAEYNILNYHVPNKKWIQEERELKRDKEIRIANALKINDALFWNSEKRNPVKYKKKKIIKKVASTYDASLKQRK